MKPGSRPVLFASLVALSATFGLFVLALLSASSSESLARALFWQGYWLQSLVPTINIGTSEHPVFEETPVHVIAFFAGIPFGLLIYFVVALAFARLYFGHGGAKIEVGQRSQRKK